MVDLKDLRENPGKYRRGAERKNVKVDVDAILRADEQRVAAQREFERLRTEQNEASKLIGKAKDASERESLKAKAGDLKPRVKDAEDRMKAAEAALHPLLLQVPQPPDDDVPVGKDASENVVSRKWGEPRHFEFKPRGHEELGKSLDIIDVERGVRLSGTRSYFLKGLGAELHQAVLRLALDLMVREKGFTQLTVPVLVREE